MLRLLAAATAGVLVLLATAFFAGRVDEPFFFLSLGAVSSLVLAPWLVLRLWPRPDPVEDAARAGTLEVHAFRSVRACQIGEIEDEGLHFLLELDSGETLFLSGQYLYAPVASGAFPCSLFRLSLEMPMRKVLALDCQGDRIEIVETLAAFTDEEIERRLHPGEFQRYGKSPHALLRDWGRKPGAGRGPP